MAEVCHSTSQNDQIGLVSVALGFAVLGACLALPFVGDPGFERNKVFAVALAAAGLLGCRSLVRVSWLGIGVLLALSMSAVVSLDPSRALIGSLERSQGVLLVWILAVFALAKLPWAMCRFWIAVTALISSVWALLQLAGVENLVLPLSWQLAELDRVFAGFGNPTALAGFLAMALPISAELAIKSGEKPKQMLGSAAVLLGAIALIASGTRAAWLGLAIAGAFVLWLAQPKQRMRHFLLLVSVLLGLLMLVFTMQRSASVQHRIELWGNAASAIRHAAQAKSVLASPFVEQFEQAPPIERWIGLRLWLGYGADMQSVPMEAAKARINPKIDPSRSSGQANFETQHRLPDRAHTLFLDSMLEFGLVGTLLLFAWVARKILQIKHEPWRLCAALAGLICWQAGFPLTAEKLVFVLVLCAVPDNALKSTIEIPLHRSGGRESLAGWFYAWRNRFASVLAIALAIFAFGPWLNPFNQKLRTSEAAFLEFRRGSEAFKSGQFDKAAQCYAAAIKFDPWRLDLRAARASAEAHDVRAKAQISAEAR